MVNLETLLSKIVKIKIYNIILKYYYCIIDRLFSKFRKPMICGTHKAYEEYKHLIEREIK